MEWGLSMNLDDIKNIYIGVMEKKIKETYKFDNNLLKERSKFILGRFEEGIGISSYIIKMEGKNKKKGISILDAGCGSGGVMLPLAYEKSFDVYGIEIFFHKEIIELKEKTNLNFSF